jgi:predicted Zn-dependent peptidase
MKDNYPLVKKILPNKLTVLLYKMPSIKSIYAVSYIKVGSSFEKQSERGISHFTEHMAFLKTKMFNNNLEMTQYAQQNGINYGASTSNSRTQYWSIFPSNNHKKGIGLLNELIFNPIIIKSEVEKEKGVILSEYNDFWHNPDRRFNHISLVNRFKNKNHPYSYRPLGLPETVEKLTKSDIVKWRKKYYSPSNLIISIAGNIDKNKILSELKNVFGKNIKGEKQTDPKFKPDYSEFYLYHQKDKRPQISFIISFPTFGLKQSSKKKRIGINLLRYILGGSSASRLNQELREKRRFVYSIGAKNEYYKWMGELYVLGTVPIEKLTKTLKIIKNQIELIKKDGVSIKELELSNSYLNAATLMQFDSAPSIAKYFIDEIFYSNKLWFPEDYIKAANKISKEYVKDIANEIFDFSKVNISLLGNVEKKQLDKIEKIYKD